MDLAAMQKAKLDKQLKEDGSGYFFPILFVAGTHTAAFIAGMFIAWMLMGVL